MLPPELIREYFTQEHFTLKKFIYHAFSTKIACSKYIIHTRSDATVHRLPTIKIDSNHNEHIDALKHLVHHEANRFIIEHLCSLKNEASVRSVIEIWSEHKSLDAFLLIVDMGEKTAIDRINFVRCCIDQLGISTVGDKKIIILLHYSPAAFQTQSFYPALFLDEWQHHFLDCVGEESASSLGMKDLMLKACLEKKESKVFDINKAAKGLIESTLKGVVSWDNFYDSQDILQGSSR